MEGIMKNKKIWLGAFFSIVLILAGTGLTYAQGSGGTFTLTDIPARFNDKFVFLEGFNERVDLIGVVSYDLDSDTGYLPRIINGRVNIPMWNIIDDGRNEKLVRYNGNHTVDIDILIFDSAEYDWYDEELAGIYFEDVTFSNGNVTISFQDNDGFDVYW